MRKEPNKKLIGIFMAGGLAVLLVVFAVFLKEKFFINNGKTLVMYFEESINGLNVGSPVVFKGVQIGKVKSIDLIAKPENLEFSIPVYVTMEKNKNSEEDNTDKAQILDDLIDKGLRARLTQQSFLTGLLMIELEMLPDTPVALHHKNADDDILEVPTALSPIGELSKGIQDLPIRQSVEEFNKFFATLNRELPQILPKMRQTVDDMNEIVEGNKGASANTLSNINKTLKNVSEAAKSMRNLADYLERHPEALLKGKGGDY